MFKKEKRSLVTLAATLAVTLVLTLLLAVTFALSPAKTAYAKRSDTLWKTIDEIYEDGSGKFNAANLSTLYQTLTGASSFAELKEKVKADEDQAITSADFRKLNANSNVSVRFGGFKWDAVYLTTAKNGDIILDLWRSSDDLTGEEIGDYDGDKYDSLYKDRSQYATWTEYSSFPDVPYPATMYSTSLIRVNALNAGGYYSDKKGKGTTLTAHPQTEKTNMPALRWKRSITA